jgi:hypothetical protein
MVPRDGTSFAYAHACAQGESSKQELCRMMAQGLHSNFSLYSEKTIFMELRFMALPLHYCKNGMPKV